MKLDEMAFGLASGATVGVLWIICSVIVWFLPGPMMSVSGHMVHGDFGMMNWSLSLVGVIIGLITWVFVAALTGWLFAAIYNRLVKS